MPSRAGTPFLHDADNRHCIGRARSYQCPLGLVLHFYNNVLWSENDSCPGVSMPSRAGTPFLRYPFENLGFMRFLEPIFAGIYQNILTMAIFRAC